MRKEGPREVEQDPLMIMRRGIERERDEGEIDPLLLLFLSFYYIEKLLALKRCITWELNIFHALGACCLS